MSLLVWVMMGIAVWHFTVFVPDRFWGGIVGAFLAAAVAAAIFGLIVNGGHVPDSGDTHVVQALLAIPGAAIGLAISFWYCARTDRKLGVDHGKTRAGSH
jgi:thiol:disulfide interchange protein